MKTLLFSILGLAICIATGAKAQELLIGGNMENEGAWNIVNYKAEVPEYTFNYTDDRPSAGQGGCLRVTCSGTQETDIIFYQEVTLTGGAQYEFTGAFRDLEGAISNFWCEALYDTAAPPPADFGGTFIIGFNTWNGTKAGVDGTFQDDFAKGTTNIFTSPGVTDMPIKVYFVIDIGVWTGGTAYSFDVAVDELSLKPVGGTNIKSNQIVIPSKFCLHQNYPNPFNPLTTISYSLPRMSTVTLKVYDLMGREMATLVNNEMKVMGNHQASFYATDFPTGVYYYKFQTESYMETKKMILIK